MKADVLAHTFGAALLILSVPSPAAAADATHEKAVFRRLCGGCHLAGPGDGDGGQGPSLVGVIGRKVAGDPEFSYSKALSRAPGVWTEPRMTNFLADPVTTIPGTRMPAKVPALVDRADIAAYLARVR